MFFGERRQNIREQWTDEELEAAIEGKESVAGLRLSSFEREEFENAKQRGYALGRRYSHVALVLRFWCRIHRQAYVYVEREQSYATVASVKQDWTRQDRRSDPPSVACCRSLSGFDED